LHSRFFLLRAFNPNLIKMRRTFVTLSVAAAILVGCKKEQIESVVKPTEELSGFNPRYEDIKPLILTFKEVAELSNYGTSNSATFGVPVL
jgi:hypothetical protein